MDSSPTRTPVLQTVVLRTFGGLKLRPFGPSHFAPSGGLKLRPFGPSSFAPSRLELRFLRTIALRTLRCSCSVPCGTSHFA
ncbi:hypothetical protein [Methanoculleus chikugoensis]|uniref:hypothetical protein n=1 Tax=Methanoculleus chikugoensis TaxID=118126 RepID=UPI001FB24E51|nr:hypothetical protein [Methanoculleus chikugoensis]